MEFLMHGDCLEKMRDIPDGAVNMVFADLPYGVTANKWDVVIPFAPLWEQLLRIGKKNCAFVFTATQPFATALINSQPKLFRYDLIWDKAKPVGFVHANHMPLRCHEHVLVFSFAKANAAAKNPMVYNPQKTEGVPYKGTRKKSPFFDGGLKRPQSDNVGTRHPLSVFSFKFNEKVRLHPTQKPVALLEWLIKTYSNPGDIVLDPTCGSGTTGVACRTTGRYFIGIEKDDKYFEISKNRIKATPWQSS